jgi:G3E family GTPase
MSTVKKSVPVVILNGFLGAGKTTLLRNLLSQCYRADCTVGVVVNEMSTLDVDGQLIGDSDIVDREDRRRFVSIAAGALSSPTGMLQLKQALAEMRRQNPPDLVIIETSGSCHPLPLIEFFRDQHKYRLTGFLVLVDSAMVAQDFALGSEIVPSLQNNLARNSRDMVNLLVEQIMFSSHLLLTKADKLSEGVLERIAAHAHELNPFVAVTSVPWGRLPLADILALPDYDFYRVGQLIDELRPALEAQTATEDEGHAYQMTSEVILDNRPFHPQRLWETCNQFLGDKIYRSKGFFWMASRDTVSLLWSQAAGSVSLELIGYWRAGILADPNNNLDEMETHLLQKRVAKSGSRFGDRHCHLTVIGDPGQVHVFTNALRACFLTEDEISAWEAGADFEDPWPTQLKSTKSPESGDN